MKGGIAMSLSKTWYTLTEAESKYGVSEALILEWIDEGLVRCEEEGNKAARVNGDDVELLVSERAAKR
jgi:predicted site-specific integrase-resolvase